jgi:hypothetical protein
VEEEVGIEADSDKVSWLVLEQVAGPITCCKP